MIFGTDSSDGRAASAAKATTPHSHTDVAGDAKASSAVAAGKAARARRKIRASSAGRGDVGWGRGGDSKGPLY